MRGFITDPAGQSGLRFVNDLPEPEPAPNQILLEVRAYSINPGEARLITQRSQGWRPGQDVAGIVQQAAADGSGPPTGARVAARVDWEGWAERVAVRSLSAAILNDRVSFEQAATLPIAGLTALRALRLGGCVLGRKVLVTGASGGVGQFAVQLAVLSGAQVTAQVSEKSREAAVRELGAHEVITSLDNAALGPFHLVLDGVGGLQLKQAIHLMTREATVVLYGGPGGTTELRLGDFYASAWNGRLVGFVSDLPEETFGEDIGILANLVADGRLSPRIGWRSSWTSTPDAFEALAKRAFHGKAVLIREIP